MNVSNIKKSMSSWIAPIINYIGFAIILIGLSSCSSFPKLSSLLPSQQTITPTHQDIWQGNPNEIWNQLQRQSIPKLTLLRSQTANADKIAWLDLALISKRYSTDSSQLINLLIQWRAQHPNHPANQIFPDNQTLNSAPRPSSPHQVALLIPQHGPYAKSGQAVREGFLNAYYARLTKIGAQNVKFYDTTTSTPIALYQQAITEGADFIIGPLLKEDVQQLLKAGPFNVPVLALNYTDIHYGSLPTHFYEFGLSPEDEAVELATRAKEAGKSHAIVIAPQSAWGKRLTSHFSTQWRALGGDIQDTWYYSSSNQPEFNQQIARLLHIDINTDKKLTEQKSDRNSLEKQRRQDFDVIFLFAQPQEARTIVPLLRYYYVNNVPIYATSAVYTGKPDPTKDVDLNGVIVCDIPWAKSADTNSINNGMPSDRLYAVGKDAYLLSELLPRLNLLPNFPIYGTTGALTLSSTQQIRRRIPCVAIHNGLI